MTADTMWWNFNRPSTLSILDLVESKTLDLKLAGLLWLIMESRASVQVASEPIYAGKTTLLHSLLDLLPPDLQWYYLRGFSEDFRLNVLLGMNLNHLVYIFKERSADNNWNRIFRIKPAIEWSVFDNITYISEYEVLANYYDFDFDEYLEDIRSFVFRRYFSRNYLNYWASPKLNISFGFRMEKEEHGRLVWDDFLQNILTKRNTKALETRIRYEWNNHFSLNNRVGFLYREDERPGAGRRDIFRYSELSFGFVYRTSQNAQVICTANRRFISRTNREDKLFQNVDLTVNWYF